ncbi:hypothetical protein ACFQV8_17595 [Pseudonocardia benzenivorans]
MPVCGDHADPEGPRAAGPGSCLCRGPAHDRPPDGCRVHLRAARGRDRPARAAAGLPQDRGGGARVRPPRERRPAAGRRRDLPRLPLQQPGVRDPRTGRLHYDGDPNELSEEAWQKAIEEFHAAHERTYGYSYKGQDPVEIVALAAAGIGELRRPPINEVAPKNTGWDEANLGDTQVFFEAKAGHEGGWVSTPVYPRDGLPVGLSTSGPAIVVQEDATFVLEPGWSMTVDKNGQILATRD